jgi:hypothetical protein
MNYSSKEERTTTSSMTIIATVALFGVVTVTIVTIPLQQQAEAIGCEAAGFMNSTAISHSKGRCLGH